MHQRITKAFTIAALGLCALVSACSSPQPTEPAKDTAPALKPISADERLKWYQDCWGDFNNGKWDEFKQCYAANAESAQYGYGKPSLSGPDAIVGSSQDFKTLAPDGHGEAQLIVVNGTHIASVYLLSGTNSGPMKSPDGKEMPATNKKFGLLFGHSIETDSAANKVVKELGIMDGVTFANQLGMSPEPGRPLMTKGAATPTIVIAKNDETEMKNVAVEQSEFAAWNMHDAAQADMYMTEDFILHDTSQPKDFNKARNSAINKGFWKAFSDAHITLSSTWAAGDYVVITGVFNGTNDGDFPEMKIKKTGNKVTAPMMEIDRLEGGKIKEGWFFVDGSTLGSQLAPAAKK